MGYLWSGDAPIRVALLLLHLMVDLRVTQVAVLLIAPSLVNEFWRQSFDW